MASSTRAHWDRYVELRREGEPLGGRGARPSAYYYSNNAVDTLRGEVEMREFLSGPGVKYIIASPRAFREELAPLAEPGARWEKVLEFPRQILVRYLP